MKKIKPPPPPLCRVIVEGTVGTCPICASTEKRKYFLFGKKIGCYNEKCPNYFRKNIRKIIKNT